MWRKRSCPFGVVMLSTVVLAACAGRQTAQLEPSGLDLSGVDVVDLSYAYDEATLYWPTSPTTFELTSLAYGPTEGGYFYSAAMSSETSEGKDDFYAMLSGEKIVEQELV